MQTKKEDYNELSKILAGLGENETDAKNLVESKMQEYVSKYKLKDLRSRASETMREVVDGIKRVLKPKNALDIGEAKMLLDKLDEMEKAGLEEDAEYIRAELEAGGFENLVKEYDEKKNAQPAAKPAEPAPSDVPAKPAEDGKKQSETTPVSPEQNTVEGEQKKDIVKDVQPGKVEDNQTTNEPKKTEETKKPKKTKKTSQPSTYDDNQKTLIKFMQEHIDYLTKTPSKIVPNSLINLIEDDLAKAQASGLENTKEYKRLKGLLDAVKDAKSSKSPSTTPGIIIPGITTPPTKSKHV